jgi:hypothetical protein
MQAIRIKQRLDSETLHLPQVRPLLGKQVEIIVLEDEAAQISGETPASDDASRYPLRGSVLRYDEPFEPAVPPEDWEANR